MHLSSLHAGLPTRATENNWLDLGLNYQYFKTAYIKTCLALTVLLNLIIVRIVLMQKYTAPNSVLTAPSPLRLYFGLGFPHACVFPLKDYCLPLRGDIAGEIKSRFSVILVWLSPNHHGGYHIKKTVAFQSALIQATDRPCCILDHVH